MFAPLSWHTAQGMRALSGLFALAAALSHFLMEPLRWRICYLPEENREFAKEVRDALYCTALATYLLPFKLGIPLRVALLHRNARLNYHLIGVLIALDGLVSLVAWSAIAAACLWITALHWRPSLQVWLIGIAAALVMFAGIAFHSRLRGRWAQRWRDALNLLDHLPRRAGLAWVIVSVDVMSYGLRHAALMILITGSTHWALTGGAIGIVATFAGIVSGLPMGLLGYDATLIALLGAAGVPVEQALWIALTNRGLNLASAALLGMPAAMRLGLGSGAMSVFRRLVELAHGRK
jgi:uncharacterized membrane protein YbhN (UPF0104 family)